jgi:hypothetical protein
MVVAGSMSGLLAYFVTSQSGEHRSEVDSHPPGLVSWSSGLDTNVLAGYSEYQPCVHGPGAGPSGLRFACAFNEAATAV